jgi:deoxyribonuclease-1-like protein
VRKPAAIVLAALIAGGAWFFFQKFQVQSVDGGIKIVPRQAGNETRASMVGDVPPAARTGDTIRIATFNIQVFGESKLSKPEVMDILARVVRQFDVVAVQEIRARSQDILPQFVEVINSTGRQYDYVIGPRLGRTTSKEQYAFIFDRASIEVDRNQLYTVEDPNDLLHREPLVGWFRVRGPPSDQAFTFTLVNIHTDPDETVQELDALAAVYRLVRDDGRQEDDVIIAGDLNVDDRHLGLLGQIPGLTWTISATPTNTRGTAQYDNIIFHEQSTAEFTGRAGVYDFMRQFNLTLEQALEVSDHLPVWAEFSVYEGGKLGRIAKQPADALRKQ